MTTIFRNFFSALFVMAFFISCHKKLFDKGNLPLKGQQINDRSSGAAIFDIDKAMETHDSLWDKIISIYARKPFGINNERNGSYKAKVFLKDSDRNSALNGNLLLGDQTLQFSTELKSYEHLSTNRFQPLKSSFGDTIAVQMRDTANVLILDNNFYIPTDLNATVTGWHNDTYSPALPRNALVTWNPDPKNDKGIVIHILFGSQTGANDPFSRYQSLATTIVTDDDGEYQLTKKSFTNMPAGASIHVEIKRGNYKTMQDTNGKHYFIYGYSVCSSYFFLE